jgi:hypothetical protein
MPQSAPVDQLLTRILGEYSETPGLRLTVPQASRFWQLDPAACESLLTALVERHALARTKDGAFVARFHR